MGVSCLRARLLLSARAAPLSLGLQTRGYKHHRHKRAEARPSLYSVLGVSPKATQAQIKVAYYQLSKLFHPDLNQGSRVAQERFAALSEAYSVLGSVHLRRRYDRGIFTERDLHGDPHASAADAAAEARKTEAAERQRQSHSVYYDAHGRRMFDFDEFFKAHYGEARAREQRERELRQRRREELQQQQERLKTPFALALGVLGSAVLLTSFLIRRG